MDLGGGADPTLLPSLPRSAEAHRPGPLPPGELSQRYTGGRADPPVSAMVGRPPGPVSVLGARSEPRHGDPEWSTSPTWSTSPIYPTLPPIFPPHLSHIPALPAGGQALHARSGSSVPRTRRTPFHPPPPLHGGGGGGVPSSVKQKIRPPFYHVSLAFVHHSMYQSIQHACSAAPAA